MRCALLVLMVLVGSAISSTAMTFDTVIWNGHEAVRATGEIEAGDAYALSQALQTVAPADHGAKLILLDSPGGSVSESLRMSALLEGHDVHMVIPDGADCASACASILFIAGDYRTVEPYGRFGQHSCSINGVPDADCNEVIAQHAFSNGVSHGSVAAFVTYVSPDDILWFSRSDVDCWGISRYPFSAESGFGKSEPCPIRGITGREPDAQAAWRVDFNNDGYRAFLRPLADHDRELELSIYCDEKVSGRLFMGMDLTGPSDEIRSAIKSVNVDALPVERLNMEYSVVQIDPTYSRIVISLSGQDVLNLLTRSDRFSFVVDVKPPYETIWAKTGLATSRDALIFAANHCMNR